MAVRYLDEEPEVAAAPSAPRRGVRYLDEPAEAAAPIVDEYNQFKAQFRAQLPQSGLQAATQASMQPLKLAGGLASGIYDLVKEGAQGVGTLLGKGSVEDRTKGTPTLSDVIKASALAGAVPGPFTTQQRADLLQTGLEVAPRFAMEGLGVPIRQGVEFAVEDPNRLARNVLEFSNPIAAAINYYSMGGEPTEAEYQRMFNRHKQNQLQAKLLEQPIVPEVIGEANIAAARAAPLILGAESLPGAIEASVRAIPTVGRETLRTLGTIASTPLSAYQLGKSAEPFLSGARAAAAQEGVQTALARQASLESDIARSVVTEGAAQQQALTGLAGERAAAATKGREALAAGRELRTAQGTVTPEIVQAQTSLAQAAELPPVILSKNAIPSEAAFGKTVLESVETPLNASKAVYDDLYKEVTQSLPTKETAVAAQPLYDAARQASSELSQGFEAYNKGTIRNLVNESARLTRTEAAAETVSPLIREMYKNATPTGKANLLVTYPELAQPVSQAVSKIPEYTWTELQQRFRQINEGINDSLKYGNANDARILGDLKEGIVRSMENYAEKMGPETNGLFKQANKAYAEHQDKFGLNRIQTLFRDDVVQNPEMVAQKLISYDNPSQVQAIKNVVSPEEFSVVQSQFAQKLLSPNANVPFEPSHFVKQFSSRGARDTVKAVFGEQGLDDFARLNDAAMDFAKIEDLQKGLDSLANQSDDAMKAFEKARTGVSKTEKAMAEKAEIKRQLDAIDQPALRSKIASVEREVQLARKELDSIQNYRQLRDWAKRFSGLNIFKAATQSQDWAALSRYAAIQSNAALEPDPAAAP